MRVRGGKRDLKQKWKVLYKQHVMDVGNMSKAYVKKVTSVSYEACNRSKNCVFCDAFP